MHVHLNDVSWGTTTHPIIKQISLDIPPGTFVGVIGPNGSGKSSLLRCIYRMYPLDTGHITLDTIDIWAMSTRTMAQGTAVVLQEQSPDFHWCVRDMVLMGRAPYKGMFDRDTPADYERVTHALEQVGMAHAAERRYQTLSGGEKQRVLMARALVQQPRFIVLDEPTNHLDIRYQMDLLALVKGLGITSIAALHDLNLAAQYCDMLYVLHAGCVVAAGPPAAVLQPDLLWQVYGVQTTVNPHPTTGKPSVTFIPSRLP